MNGFSLARVPEIAGGPARIASLGGDVARLAGEHVPVLLVADPGLGELGLTARAADAIAAAGHTVQRFDDIASDAREAQVASGARLAREMGARMVVGLGGGSALDAAKMIAMLGAEEAKVSDYRLAAEALPERRIPLLCAPTTAGTGSEATSVSVLSSERGTKYWYWSAQLKPDFVVLDPELTVTLPAALTAATGLDALVHAIEAATNRNATNANDTYALSAIRLCADHLTTAVRWPDDLEARMGLLQAACFAGIAIDNAGTALAHNIGHALGSLVYIHHGRAVALAMAATLPWVMEGNEETFIHTARAFGLDSPSELPGRFRQLLDEVGLDTSLPRPLEASVLAEQMAAPQNAAMRAATSRIVGDDDLFELAERVIAFASGRSEAA